MVMEHVPGDDLGRLMASGELPPRELLEILAQVCDGLAFAHQRGVLHRAINPANIRLTRFAGRLTAKILDFGIPRLAGSDPAAGALPGSLGYLAPECVQSGKPDARSDLFAVGAILYEALAGYPPFGGETTATVLHRIVNEEPAPLDPERLAGISPAIAGVAARALAKDPTARYPGAEALAEALRAARDPWWNPAEDKAVKDANTRLLPMPEKARKPAQGPEAPASHTWLYLGVAAVTAALVAGGGWLWLRHRRHRPAPVVIQPVAPPPVAPPVQPPPEPPATDPATAETAPAEPPKTEPAPPPAKGGSYATLDQADRALDTDPKGALAFLDALVKRQPENERAVALRIAALYEAGDYRGCSLAIRESRQAGHELWPMALRHPRLRKALEQEKTTPHLSRRKEAQ